MVKFYKYSLLSRSIHLVHLTRWKNYVRFFSIMLASLTTSLAYAGIETGDLSLTVAVQHDGNTNPYAKEMVLLRIHGVYKQAILLEELTQPSLTNFSWTQLGRDRWSKTTLPNGQSAIAFDRTIAMFPHHVGTFTIEPFVHKLTVDQDGQRQVVTVRSEATLLTASQWTADSGGPDSKEAWWLPARNVTITDSWNPDPETLKIGESTRRTVTLEAQGVLVDRLPPRPVMRTRGILTFAGPVLHETLLTPSGPVARATYQWDVKLGVPEAISLNAIDVPWFDTVSRRMRTAEIPARQISSGLPTETTDQLSSPPPSPLLFIAAGVCSFGLGLTLIATWNQQRETRLSVKVRRSLKQAAKQCDHRQFYIVLKSAIQERNTPMLKWKTQAVFKDKIATIEELLYGYKKTADLDLNLFSRDLCKNTFASDRTHVNPLEPLK